ncbi:protein AAR2 homolog [Nematostella vectensis]|uniref:protein AAR2 homolog n=1 Tax=Nematostella vectensis TaxID=45351 RepID=UPI002077414E|nr:protein AAR2 homolog [Nematostella vectensis]
MDPVLAKKRFEEGAFILCLDVPQGTEFGIDCNSWEVGPRFKGVKMVPPGIHFVFYSAVNREGNAAPRTGFFCVTKKGDIVVRKWDPAIEDLVNEKTSEEDLKKYRLGMKELDTYLGPYPFENHKKWLSLTSHISANILARLQPDCGQISSVTQIQSEDSPDDGSSQMDIDKPTLNVSLQQNEKSRIKFTKIPKCKYPAGACPVEVTKYSIDSSFALECMLQKLKDKKEILGELQFAFVCFLLGQVYDGFEHWKRLLNILCTCDDALCKHPDLFTELIGVLYFQLKEAPKDFFVDIVTRNNFLTVTLQEFFSNLDSSPEADSTLATKAKRFKQHLTKTFQWDFDSEPDDYEPVVVDT